MAWISIGTEKVRSRCQKVIQKVIYRPAPGCKGERNFYVYSTTNRICK